MSSTPSAPPHPASGAVADVTGSQAVDPGAAARAVAAAVGQVVRGSEQTVRLVTCALFSGGHVLVEDLPGTGKTTMAKAFARSIGGSFARIQATADLMPSDVTGSGVWEPGQGAFRFVPGPVFANVLVVDELNRTPARTQSAFMEALDEGSVTVDSVRHPLPDPFFAIATQNPTEQHGTFALPEGELDRFAVSVGQGSLDLATEVAVVRDQLVQPTVDMLAPVLSPADLRAARAAVRQTYVAEAVLHHAVQLVRATRSDSRFAHGASSRAAIALVRTAQAHAVLQGREFVTPDDTKAVAVAVLAHRVMPQGATPARATSQALVADLLARVPVPMSA